MKKMWKRAVSIILTLSLALGLAGTDGLAGQVQAAAAGVLTNGELTANADGWTIGGDFAKTDEAHAYNFESSYLSIFTQNAAENAEPYEFEMTQTVEGMAAGNYYIQLAAVGNGNQGESSSNNSLSVKLSAGAENAVEKQIVTDGWDNWDNMIKTDALSVGEGAAVTVTISGTMLADGDWYGIKNVALKDADEADTTVEAPITVKKVEGLSEDFIHGIDISTYLSEIQSGVKYYDQNGQEQSLFQILSDSGVNYIRLRVWNCPYQVDSDGGFLYIDENKTEYTQSQITKSEKNAAGYMEYFVNDTQVYRKGYGAGNSDADTAVEIAKQAAEYGINVLVDFHYSDFWSDPKKYTVPKAWKNMPLEDKKTALAAFTTESLQKFKDANVTVGMVQVGNEINNGMAGETDQSNIVALVKAGCEAVRTFDPNILIAVHYTDPQSEGYQMGKAQALADAGVDYDIFGTSYYPFWHGTTSALTANLKEIADTFNKKVMVAEISYAWTAADGDGYGNVVTGNATDQTYSYPVSLEGQAAAVRDAIAAVSAVGEKGIGTFYWEGAWVPVNEYSKSAENAADILAANRKAWMLYGSGWGTEWAGEYDFEVTEKHNGNTWDNQSFFDFSGKVLESLNVYKYVYTGAAGPVSVSTVDTAAAAMNYKTTPVLPGTVNVKFNDGTVQEVAVTWNQDEVNQLTTADYGEYTISGSLAAFSYEARGEIIEVPAGTYTTTCLVTISGENYVMNPSFETGDLTGWTLTDNLSAGSGAKIDKSSSNAKTGLYYIQGWGNEIDFNIEQTIASVPKGVYQLFAYYQGTSVSDASKSSLYAAVTYKDGTTKNYDAAIVFNNIWKDWSKSVIKGIEITSDVVSVKVGSKMACTGVTDGGGAWIVMDDTNLVKEADLPAGAEYTVTFADGTRTEKQIVRKGKAAAAPVWTKNGYTLSWDKNYNNVTSDVTVRAVWKKISYKISYSLNGGKNSVKNPSSYDVEKAVSLADPTRRGYKFAGWYADSRCKTKVTAITKGSTGNKTLYAKWTAEKYRITYKLNKGKNSSKNPASYTIEKAVSLKNPTRKGYTFAGWYKDSKFKKKYSAVKKGTTGNITVYAKWNKVSTAKVKKPAAKNISGKKLSVSWKKVSGAAGYQVAYSTSSKYKKSATRTITTTSLKKTLSKLKKGKTYYVKVRAYKKDSTGAKVYGSYSSSAKVKIKK